jgi:pimeloyl-ACP methyl ester carboxylesterase
MTLVKIQYTLIICACLICPTASAQKISGNFQPGFTVDWRHDFARSFANNKYDKDKRRVLTFIWYPAQASKEEPQTYETYFRHLLDPDSSQFGKDLLKYSMNSFKKNGVSWHFKDGDTNVEQAVKDVLITRFTAVKNATPVENGLFPVIIYHPGLGGNIIENIDLFESLARKGYIVISSPFLHQPSWQDQFYCGDISTSVKDIDFILNNVVPTIPNANRDLIGVMGHSFGAQVSLVYATQENNIVDAVISLDNTLDYKSAKDLESPFYKSTSFATVLTALTDNVQNCKAKILAFADSDADGARPSYEVVKRLYKTERYFGTFGYPVMHESYLSESVRAYKYVGKYYKDEFGPQVLEKNAGAYSLLNEKVLDFLDFTLKGKSAPKGSGSALSFTHEPPVSLPSGEEMLKSSKNNGMLAVKQQYSEMQALSPRARLNMNNILDDLAVKRQFTELIDLLQFLLKYHTADWRLMVRLADGYATMGNTEAAVTEYERAMTYCDDEWAYDEIETKRDELTGGE